MLCESRLQEMIMNAVITDMKKTLDHVRAVRVRRRACGAVALFARRVRAALTPAAADPARRRARAARRTPAARPRPARPSARYSRCDDAGHDAAASARKARR